MGALKVAIPLFAAAVLLSGCGKAPDNGGANEGPQVHRSVPPHGGTPVALGADYNLELVRDRDAGILSAYLLDDEMEEFVRSSSRSITIVASMDGEPHALVLGAIANRATGETVGDTSLFQAKADWLKRSAVFSGTVQGVAVRGADLGSAAFNFPGGSEK